MPPPISLAELEAKLIARTPNGSRVVRTMEEAEGVRFLCPLCFHRNGGAVGTHAVICWGPTVPAAIEPGPGRWTLAGTSIADLTLNGALGKSRSVLLTSGCGWHGYVTNGRATDT